MIVLLNPSQVILQVAAQDIDGTPKLNVASGTVRVYHITGAGAEVEDLASVPLVQVGATNTWRYRWVPASLAVDDYFAEYTLVDTNAKTYIGLEDILVRDMATQTDLAILKQVETGRWKIIANQMIFYEDDGVTPLLTFDLKDEGGVATMIDVFERVPAP